MQSAPSRAISKINDDESRHLGVGFHVLEMQGHGPVYLKTLKALGTSPTRA